ncbi:hypothetical protein GCM10010201_32340 [Pilimelia columellifera subsp. columellifera]|uniref:Uncharacterized protein n=1 Tax=Pilimelia columellifera subsp. columellifera TaxID=706583 RepID=A0ABN3NQ18_9ACTN
MLSNVAEIDQARCSIALGLIIVAGLCVGRRGAAVALHEAVVVLPADPFGGDVLDFGEGA